MSVGWLQSGRRKYFVCGILEERDAGSLVGGRPAQVSQKEADGWGRWRRGCWATKVA